jgi:hypothetical protein
MILFKIPQWQLNTSNCTPKLKKNAVRVEVLNWKSIWSTFNPLYTNQIIDHSIKTSPILPQIIHETIKVKVHNETKEQWHKNLAKFYLSSSRKRNVSSSSHKG